MYIWISGHFLKKYFQKIMEFIIKPLLELHLHHKSYWDDKLRHFSETLKSLL